MHLGVRLSLMNPPVYSDVHLRTPCHEPQTRDVLRLGLYVSVWTAAVLEDVSSETSFFHPSPVVAGPPPKKNSLARPAPQICSPARLGPGSRGVVPRRASSGLLDRPLVATTVSRWLEMLPRWFLDRFGTPLDSNLGSSWASLGSPWGPKMQYIFVFFDVFAH